MGCRQYGRGTPQFGTLGSHTGFLACGGFASHSFVCLMAAADTAPGGPFPARLPTSCNRRSCFCLFRGHSCSLPGHTRPHFTHSRRGIPAVWRCPGRLKRSIFSNSRRTASPYSVGAGSVVGRAINSCVIACSCFDRRTFPAAVAPPESRNCGRAAERRRANVSGHGGAKEIARGSLASSRCLYPFSATIIPWRDFPDRRDLVSPPLEPNLYRF